MSKKDKLAVYLTPEKKTELGRRYHEDGSRSMTVFADCTQLDEEYLRCKRAESVEHQRPDAL